MERGLRKLSDPARMVVMHMGKDHVLDLGGVNPEQRQAFGR